MFSLNLDTNFLEPKVKTQNLLLESITYKVVNFGCRFHGFTFKAGFVWGKSLDGTEFAASGWRDGECFFVYRRHSDGIWIGGWERIYPEWIGDKFCPATDAAQLLSEIFPDEEEYY